MENLGLKLKYQVPSVESFRKYIRNNPMIKMYLQSGLDSIPEVV